MKEITLINATARSIGQERIEPRELELIIPMSHRYTMATENGLLCNAPDRAYHRMVLQRDESLVLRNRLGVGNCDIPSLLSRLAFVQEAQ